jgi:hypothetical protein
MVFFTQVNCADSVEDGKTCTNNSTLPFQTMFLDCAIFPLHSTSRNDFSFPIYLSRESAKVRAGFLNVKDLTGTFV